MKQVKFNLDEIDLDDLIEIRKIISRCDVKFLSTYIFTLIDPSSHIVDEIEGYGFLPEIELL